MERIKRRAELFDEFKRHPRPVLCVRDRFRPIIPWPDRRARPELVREPIPEGMPIHDREPQPILHRPSFDFLAGIVMFERQRILRVRAFVTDL